jgi:hypothetical protein
MEKKVKLSKGKQEIKDFCEKHNACADGREWAMKQRDMSAVWAKAKYDWMMWIIQRPGLIDDKTLRMFACWCARNTPCDGGKTTWDMMPDDASRNAVIVSERYAEGKATYDELSSAWASASASASASARASVSASARASASVRASASARAMAEKTQLKQLRKMVNPFKVAKHG